MRRRDVFAFLLGVAAAALVGWIVYDVNGLIPSEPTSTSMVREMDGGRCMIIIGYSTAKDADVKRRWPNNDWARESSHRSVSAISPNRLEKGGNEQHTSVFSSKAEAIECRDRLLKAIGEGR